MSDARLPACFGAYPGVVLRLSPAGTVLESNGGLERELGRDLVGSRFADVLDAGSSGLVWDAVLAGAAGQAGELRELVFAGTDTLAEPRVFVLIRDGAGLWLLEQRHDPRLDSLRELVTDVNTELANAQRELVKERARLREALRELERSNRALDEFAHVVSHDLKAPLRAIANYARFLREDAGPALDGEARAHLDRLCDRTERMRALIDGVLSYARAGREHAPPQQVDTGALVREALELLETGDASVVIDPDMPVLITERTPLQQVFLNLLGNALRYAGRVAHGRVDVSAADAGAYWEFVVADNGPGIPAAQQSRIWGLFDTLEPAGTGGGTGIGLAVVRQLVEAQGGSIRVESQPGAGAAFRWQWPKQPRGRERT